MDLWEHARLPARPKFAGLLQFAALLHAVLPPLQVPNNQNVKLRFKYFYLQEPNVVLGTCSKDYVEINGER